MANDMKLSMVLTGKDQGAKKLLQETERYLQRAGAALREQGRQSAARERLGIRSERAIQREILQTQAAYNRLARSGRSSANELQRAAAATKNRIRELNAELQQGIEKQSRWGKAAKVGGSVIAGGVAAYNVAKPAADRKKELDAEILKVSAAAYGQDMSKSPEWIATKGAEEIKSVALGFVKANRGSADAALGYIKDSLANGMEIDEIKASGATGHKLMVTAAESVGSYDSAGTAKLINVLSKRFKGEDLDKAINTVTVSAMQGKFEINDFIKHLPALSPLSEQAGLTGLDGLIELASILQSAANKTASADEAANITRNLLEKSQSADTTKRMGKTENPNKKGQGIDWEKTVLAAQARGESAVSVLAKLVEQKTAQRPDYAETKRQADAGDGEAKALLNTMKAFEAAKIMVDVQAKSGLMAASDLAEIKAYQDGLKGFDPKNMMVDRTAEIMSYSKLANDEGNVAEKELSDNRIADAAGMVESKWLELAAAFPEGTLAMQALTAAAMAASLSLGAMSLLGGKGLPAGGSIRAAAGAAGRFGLLGAGAVAGGLGLFDANKRINRNEHRGLFEGGWDSRAAGYGEAAISGAVTGAVVGSVVPVIGTAIGTVAGGLIGLVGAAVTDLWKDKPQTPAGVPPLLAANPPEPMAPLMLQQTADYTAAMQANGELVGGKLEQLQSVMLGANQTINNNMTVTLDGRVIANEVSRHQYLIFNRGAGQ